MYDLMHHIVGGDQNFLSLSALGAFLLVTFNPSTLTIFCLDARRCVSTILAFHCIFPDNNSAHPF